MIFFFKVIESFKIILQSKKSIFSFFKKGSSIASTQILFSLKQKIENIGTVIDVGANQGQFALSRMSS